MTNIFAAIKTGLKLQYIISSYQIVSIMVQYPTVIDIIDIWATIYMRHLYSSFAFSHCPSKLFASFFYDTLQTVDKATKI